MTVYAQLGGQKQVIISGGGAPVQKFIGTSSSRSAIFQFDLKPPVHCLSNKTDGGNCQYFAIYLDQDIRTVRYVLITYGSYVISLAYSLQLVATRLTSSQIFQ